MTDEQQVRPPDLPRGTERGLANGTAQIQRLLGDVGGIPAAIVHDYVCFA